jgi:nicotinate-nucleotide adenylyltransferase
VSRASRVFAGIPPHGAGQRIGLFGGSFDPAHAGHRLVSLMALKRLQLDWPWWLVSPGNPLKAGRPPPLDQRLHAAAQVAAHPRLVVTGLEAELGTIYTADLVAGLTLRCPAARFVWIMGSDALAQLHLWRDWRAIAASVPIAVVNRPGFELAPLCAPAARALAGFRLPDSSAPALADASPPAWLTLVGPRIRTSSTALRQKKCHEDVAAPTRRTP